MDTDLDSQTKALVFLFILIRVNQNFIRVQKI